MSDESTGHARISRRDLLKSAGAAGAAALIPGNVGAASPAALPAPAALPVGPPVGPLMNLTAQETEILSAMVDRLIPSDEMGPGALEAGAVRFIDRALSEAESDSVGAYRAGLAALDSYSRSSHGGPFVELSDDDKDAVLVAVQAGNTGGAEVDFDGSSGAFFNMVKSHTWQGTFGDPMYGGNVNFIGWDILGYPGVRMRVSPEDQRLMEEGQLPPARRSAYEYGQFQMTGGQE
jgi:gluconate 2-dehydrogenase gamma chain